MAMWQRHKYLFYLALQFSVAAVETKYIFFNSSNERQNIETIVIET